MSAPPTDPPATVSTSGYEDGLGRRTLVFDREYGVMLERLFLRPELAAFEQAFLSRMARLSAFEDQRFARIRALERDDATGGLTVISEFVPGIRLSDVLDAEAQARDENAAPSMDVALGVLLELLPALGSLHTTAGLTHGAVGPGRMVLTPAGQIVLMDDLFGAALERLEFTPARLWKEFGIAMPVTAEASGFGVAGDIAQATLTAVSVVVGRSLKEDDYPDGLPSVLMEVVEIAQIRGSAAFAANLQRFLQRTLPLPGQRPYSATEEAVADLQLLVRAEIGILQCRAALNEFAGVATRMSDVAPPMVHSPSAVAAKPRPAAPAVRERAAPVAPSIEPAVGSPSVSPAFAAPPSAATLSTAPPPAAPQSTAPPSAMSPSAATPSAATPSAATKPAIVQPVVILDPLPVERPPTPVVANEVAHTSDVVETWIASPISAAPAHDDMNEASTVSQSGHRPVDVVPSTPPERVPVPVASFWEPPLVEAPAPSAPAFAIEPASPRPSEYFAAVPDLPAMAPVAVEETPAPREQGLAPQLPVEPALAAPQAVEAPSEAVAAPPSPRAGDFRRKRSRSPKAKRDKLRSISAPPPPVVAAPVVAAPALAAPVVAPTPAPPPAPPRAPLVPIQAPDTIWEAPEVFAAPQKPFIPPPRPAAPAPPRPAAEIRWQPPAVQMPVAPVAPVAVAQVAAPSAPIRLKTEPPKSYVPVREAARRQPDADHFSARPLGERNRVHDDAPSTFPWKLAAAAVLMMVVGVGAGRSYLPAREKPKSAAPSPAPAPAIVEAPAAPTTGTLSVTTQPAGAHVLLDGKPAGETPLTIVEVAKGRHIVTFITSGGAVKRAVRVEAGKTLSLDVPVFSGWVGIDAPIVLEISENGRSVGTTEQGHLMLTPGDHTLTLTNRDLGYTAVRTVTIEPGEQRSITVEPRGILNLNAVPWAEVWIDGQKVGETPVANLQVLLGTREIIFRHPQFGERKMTATVKANAATALSIDLTKPPQF